MLVSSTSEGCQRFPADKVNATDTVGAGDAFLGSLGAYLARGMALEDAIGKAVRYEKRNAPCCRGRRHSLDARHAVVHRHDAHVSRRQTSAFVVRLQLGGEIRVVIQDAGYTS